MSSESLRDTSTTTVKQDPPASARDVVPQLFVILGCERAVVAPSRHRLDGLNEIEIGRGEPRARRDLRGRRLVLRVPDRAMSAVHSRLFRLRERWILEDAGAKNGVLVNGSVVERAVLLDGDILEMGNTLLAYRVARPAHPELPDLVAAEIPTPVPGLPTFMADLAAALDGVARVAPTTLPVVVTGATGTGKEIVARAIHVASGRSGAFVPVNCGGLPAPLVESILFGHRRGAFSGADQDRPGLIRSAEHGTFFLDEIGDLPSAVQVTLLRFLQNGEVLPVGETRPVRVDIRVVAAAQRPLAELVAEGRFRPDLAARLGGLALHLPRLAERREDLGLLIGELLPGGAGLSLPAARALASYAWPLNIRELEKALAVAAVMARDEPIRLEHLPEPVRSAATGPHVSSDDDSGRLRTELIALLREHRGNMAEVARIMGKARTQVSRWVKRFGIELEAFRL